MLLLLSVTFTGALNLKIKEAHRHIPTLTDLGVEIDECLITHLVGPIDFKDAIAECSIAKSLVNFQTKIICKMNFAFRIGKMTVNVVGISKRTI